MKWNNWFPFTKFAAKKKQKEILLGLGSPVELRSDSKGVHHIFAQHEDDLFRAQGFVTARDRLFQMDMFRRMASGRLAEVYGNVPGTGFDSTLHLRGQGLASVDYFMRVLGLQSAATEGLSWVSSRTHRALLAYAEGVNEYIIAARKRRDLPLGYKILQHDPEIWHPTDSLLIMRLFAWRLSFTWRLLLGFGGLCEKLSDKPEHLESLLPPNLNLSLGLDSLENGLGGLFSSNASMHKEEEEKANKNNIFPSGTGQGSCCWVISGAHTQSGMPILCNDPHLLLRLPSAFYQIRLHGGEYNVTGLSLPGTVGVYVGHNNSIAWGATANRIDDSDIFIEDVDQGRETHRHHSRYIPFVRRQENISVRGEKPKLRWVRSTSRGPLISDALRGPISREHHYSLAWTGHEGAREAEAWLQINRAQNWSAFREALRYARVPALSYAYADKKGHIGAVYAGRCPIRTHSPRIFRPLQAAEARYEWKGDIPYDEQPFVFDPPSGKIILCGQAPDESYPEHKLQGIWASQERVKRIEHLFKNRREQHSDNEWMARIQRDQYDLGKKEWFFQTIEPMLLQKSFAPQIQKRLEYLLQWNGLAGKESTSATYLTMFQLKMLELTYKPVLGENLFRRWLDIAEELEAPVEALFRAPELWFKKEQQDILNDAFTQSYHELERRLGTNTREWNWGNIHRLTLRPLFFWDGGLQGNFTRGAFHTGGNNLSLNAGNFSWSRPFEHRVGASARMIIDLDDWEHSSWILCGGQEEAPDAKHYDDQLNDWLRGDHIPMLFRPDTLQKTKQSWILSDKKDTPTSLLHQLEKDPTYQRTEPKVTSSR